MIGVDVDAARTITGEILGLGNFNTLGPDAASLCAGLIETISDPRFPGAVVPRADIHGKGVASPASCVLSKITFATSELEEDDRAVQCSISLKKVAPTLAGATSTSLLPYCGCTSLPLEFGGDVGASRLSATVESHSGLSIGRSDNSAIDAGGSYRIRPVKAAL